MILPMFSVGTLAGCSRGASVGGGATMRRDDFSYVFRGHLGGVQRGQMLGLGVCEGGSSSYGGSSGATILYSRFRFESTRKRLFLPAFSKP